MNNPRGTLSAALRCAAAAALAATVVATAHSAHAAVDNEDFFIAGVISPEGPNAPTKSLPLVTNEQGPDPVENLKHVTFKNTAGAQIPFPLPLLINQVVFLEPGVPVGNCPDFPFNGSNLCAGVSDVARFLQTGELWFASDFADPTDLAAMITATNGGTFNAASTRTIQEQDPPNNAENKARVFIRLSATTQFWLRVTISSDATASLTVSDSLDLNTVPLLPPLGLFSSGAGLLALGALLMRKRRVATAA